MFGTQKSSSRPKFNSLKDISYSVGTGRESLHSSILGSIFLLVDINKKCIWFAYNTAINLGQAMNGSVAY